MQRVLWLGLVPIVLAAAVLSPAVAQSVESSPSPSASPSASPTPPAESARVVEIAGTDRITTAIAASRYAYPDGSASVVLAAADGFADGLAAAPLAAREDAPLLLVGDRAGGPVLDEIRRLGATRAVVVAAYGAVPVVVQLELRRAGLDVERVAGDSRFDTAALLARRLGASAAEALLASGGHFADALAGAPLAAREGLPLLLTAPDRMLADPEAALAALEVRSTLLLGGEAALGPDVAQAAPGARRLSGPDRYRTGLAVAEELLARGGSLSTVAVATGLDFADALAAGPLAGRADGPLLLVHGQDLEQAAPVVGFLRRHRDQIGTLVLFGGQAAIGPEVRQRLVRAAGAVS